ncbi:lipocalin family protein [Hymenobacter wooponensis]|uniref:lipocalin family protein n=1 Tax=Hymenobacter wooponensis TaxID=1525360 RepID=UPI0014369AED|nr:lipocalin family protein [Hymenobacter wooponensis]
MSSTTAQPVFLGAGECNLSRTFLTGLGHWFCLVDTLGLGLRVQAPLSTFPFPMANLLKRRRPTLFTAIAATVATGVAAYAYAKRKMYPELPTVTHVDLHKYKGLWYEVARLPTRFEKGCQHVTAEYKLRPDGKVQVLNTCHKEGLNGPAETATALARSVDASNSKLKVQFFWPFEGDYWILDLDHADYQYALVGEPSRKNLWILSRMPHLERSIRDRLIAHARNLGFPVDNLIYTPQPMNEKP